MNAITAEIECLLMGRYVIAGQGLRADIATSATECMTNHLVILIADTREPRPHPWTRWLPSHVQLERAKLDTGDLALKGFETGAVIERKTVSDLLGCIGSQRDRFERELQRAASLRSFCVVVEGHLSDVLAETRAIHREAIIGTLAAWERRHCNFVFTGKQIIAAEFSWRYLAGQLRDAEKSVTVQTQQTQGANP